MPNVAIDYIFEASWEVCNKIGGIYTVLSTKAKTLQKLYKDRVIFIGPDVWTDERPALDFTESKTVLKKWRETALLPEGLEVRVGRWDIPGKPIAILVKFDSMYASKDEFYGHLWERFGVDSLHAYGDYDEACAFGRAAAAVIESLVEFFGDKANNVIAHFDEWTLGTGLLTVKERVEKAATVFTTHATSIGRSICGNGKPLYDYLPGYDGDQMARELNMESKHSLEKAAAREADCFTTVSDVTARESEQLLCRRPDVVTPNGFEKNFVPAAAKYPAARAEARETMLNVASALTGQKYDHNTFIVVTSGRCEYRNKGIDLFLDSCATLENCEICRNVLAFVMVPAWSKEPRADLSARIAATAGKKRIKAADKAPLDEPVITHWLNNPESDPIINRIKQLGFADTNRRVNVIYVPCYLNGTDGIFNKSYYDLIIGADATVFPSYYEPWGYTPLESVAFGVPTVTTSLSGFGQWALEAFDNYFDECGVNVIGRGDSNYSGVVESVAHSIEYLTCASEKEYKKIQKAAMKTAAAASWANFIKYYEEAYDIALRKVK